MVNKAEVLSKLEGKLTAKYGDKLAKFVVTRLAPKFVPLVGQATLAKDVYDAVKAGLEFFESEGIELPEILERSKVVAAASGGSQLPEGDDSDDEKDDGERVENPAKGESKIWKNFKPYKGKYKTNGLKGKNEQFYEWDHTHNDIEVYDHNKKHIGSMDPTTGTIYKSAVPGRIANGLK